MRALQSESAPYYSSIFFTLPFYLLILIVISTRSIGDVSSPSYGVALETLTYTLTSLADTVGRLYTTIC